MGQVLLHCSGVAGMVKKVEKEGRRLLSYLLSRTLRGRLLVRTGFVGTPLRVSKNT